MLKNKEETRRSVVYIVDVECGKEPVRAQSWVGEQPEVPVVFIKFFIRYFRVGSRRTWTGTFFFLHHLGMKNTKI